MSNIQTGAERMPHDLSHLGFLAGQIGRLITISTTPVIAGDSFEMDAVGALRLSPLRRGLAIDSTVDIFTFYVPHRHVYGEQRIKFMKDGVNATPLPTVNTTGYIDQTEERRVGKQCNVPAQAVELELRILLQHVRYMNESTLRLGAA